MRRRLRIVLVPGVLGAVLAAAGAANVAVVIGSNPSAVATGNTCSAGVACTHLQTVGGVPSATAPFSGVVMSWRVKSGSAGAPVVLRVIHR